MSRIQHFDGATLQISVESAAPVLTIRLVGDLDAACQDQVEAVANQPTPGTHVVVLDLADLTFCDGAGVDALNLLRSTHEAEGRAVLMVNASPMLRRTLAILERAQRFPTPRSPGRG